MQRKIFTIQHDETVEMAQTKMVVNSIRHLPVMDGGRLVGIISDRDVRGVLIPQRGNGGKKSNQTFYLPRDVKVEEAARLLVTHKIGCLPVVDKGKVVGIITDTDILWVFCEIMGVLESSSRIDITLGRDPQAMEKATEIIRKNDGRIISVGIHPNSGKRKKIYSFRLKSCDTGPIVAGLEKAGYKVQDEVD
jgi:acetoin utilization protein AcuB